jgi:hypothetical protein
MIDKKNENKKVAVEDFLLADSAIEAIKYSMWGSWDIFFWLESKLNDVLF